MTRNQHLGGNLRPGLERALLAAAASLALMVLPGCGGLLVGGGGLLARSLTTEKVSYEKVNQRAGPIEPGESRIWIYVVGGGPDFWNTTGRQEGITFNERSYFCAGDTFNRIDLPAGEYLVSIGNVMGGFGAPRLGRFREYLNFKPEQEHFIRVAIEAKVFNRNDVMFELVDKLRALPEMESMQRLRDGRREYGRVKGYPPDQSPLEGKN